MSQRQAAFAHFSRASNLYRQVCYAEAVECYLAGLKINPVCVEAHADLAKAYEKLGCWNQAIESLDTALRLRPGDPTALRRKQRILEEKSIYDSLTDELNLALDAANQHKSTNAVQVKPSRNARETLKLEHDFFTLTAGRTIPQNLLLLVSQIIEHTYRKVGKVFQCYPQCKVPVFIDPANQIDTPHAANPVINTTSPVKAANHTLFSDVSLPQWAVACYGNGSIRLTYRPYSDSSIGVLYAVVRHEWTHLLIDLLAEGRCPNWLDEGLAQFIARPLMNSEKVRLQQASRDGHLLPLHLLQKPFQDLSEKQRRLAYLQSYATTKYLIQQFSFAALREILERLGGGQSTDTAFQEVFVKTEEEIVVASSAKHCMIV
jgi:tetratricopeptide (TPR) repeat protein